MADLPTATSSFPGAAEQPWSRRDLLWLAACCILAAAVRLPGLGDVGLTHYDEGGYAMSAQAVARDDDRLYYPNRHLLAPPVVYSLQGASLRLFGEQDGAIIGLSVAIGIFAVACLFVLARTWFGTAVAGGAGMLAALSDYFIAYSRVGLTDMLFLALLCAALAAYTWAERTRKLPYSLLAGVLTGLAWNTKYHGWLAGVIAGAALLPRLLPALAPPNTPLNASGVHGRDAFLAGLGRILIAAAVATAMYVPWFMHIQSLPGGYAAFAAYQSDYLQPGNALQSLLLHLRFQQHIVGVASQLAPAVALLVTGTLMARQRLALVLWAVALFAASRLLGLSAVIVGLALVGATYLLRERRDHVAFMALAFAAAFACLSPLYKAYARLLLPLITACYLLAAVGLHRIAVGELPGVSSRQAPAWREWATAGAMAAVLSLASVLRGPQPAGETYRPSTGFREASRALLAHLPQDRAIIVVGEPVVVFYLRALGRTVWHSNGPDDFASITEPGQQYSLVVGRYAGGDVDTYSKAHPGVVGPALGRAAVASTSDVRLLDDTHPYVAARWTPDGHLRYDLTAFAFNPPAAKTATTR